MKIPSHSNILDSDVVVDGWVDAAIKVGIETGIFVEVILNRRDGIPSGPISEIRFGVMHHRFDNLKDLIRALDNKAFL